MINREKNQTYRGTHSDCFLVMYSNGVRTKFTGSFIFVSYSRDYVIIVDIKLLKRLFGTKKFVITVIVITVIFITIIVIT